MRKAYVEGLQPGMVLGKDVRNERGDVLLARGVTLSAKYISALRRMGFYAVYVRDGVADDVDPPDLLTERVRVATAKHVRQLFAVAFSAVSNGTRNRRQRPAQGDLMSAAVPNVARLYRDVERIIDQAANTQVLTGVASLKSHDNYTFEHSVEVAVVGVVLGLRLRLVPGELHQLALGCLCHDIGKVAVPQEILNKPGPLEQHEIEIVRKHPETGFEMLRQMIGASDIIARHVVLQHHEWQNGNGYPRLLRGLNEFSLSREGLFGRGLILPAAEIAAVAEVYASLASDQPYRKALPPTQIVKTLQKAAGSHLNEEVVRRFLSILPLYPVGTRVLVTSGRLHGYRGVVTKLDPSNAQRPVVRILFDSTGSHVTPFEVDTAEDPTIELALASHPDSSEEDEDLVLEEAVDEIDQTDEVELDTSG